MKLAGAKNTLFQMTITFACGSSDFGFFQAFYYGNGNFQFQKDFFLEKRVSTICFCISKSCSGIHKINSRFFLVLPENLFAYP